MAAKPAAASPESSATAALAQNPPTISLSSHVLSSALKFPSEPVIAYAIYSTEGHGLSTVHSENVELARREVLRRRTSTTTNTNTNGTQPNTTTKHGILESLLASVLVERETLHLYVFGVSSVGETMQWSETLKALNFDGLTRELLSLSTDFDSLCGTWPCRCTVGRAVYQCTRYTYTVGMLKYLPQRIRVQEHAISRVQSALGLWDDTPVHLPSDAGGPLSAITHGVARRPFRPETPFFLSLNMSPPIPSPEEPYMVANQPPTLQCRKSRHSPRPTYIPALPNALPWTRPATTA